LGASIAKRAVEVQAKKVLPTKKNYRCALPSCKKTAQETAEKVLYKDKAHRGSIRYCFTHSKEFIMSEFEPWSEQV
jgi:effector-binding domain-containing protein